MHEGEVFYFFFYKMLRKLCMVYGAVMNLNLVKHFIVK